MLPNNGSVKQTLIKHPILIIPWWKNYCEITESN